MPTPNGAFVRHGAVWIALLGMLVTGIWRAAVIDGDVQDLKDEVERRRSAMAMIEGNQRDIARNATEIVEVRQRLEQAVKEIEEVLDRRVEVRGSFERLVEHVRTLDQRVVHLERRSEDDRRRNGGQR